MLTLCQGISTKKEIFEFYSDVAFRTAHGKASYGFMITLKGSIIGAGAGAF